MHADFDHLRLLPLAEKLQIVEILWTDIATSDEEFPLPDWLHTETEQRLAEHDKDPTVALTREEVWQRVDEKRG